LSFDILIIGAGLSGLFAGTLAARRGKKAIIIARGIGGTHVGTGTIDIAKEPALVSRPSTDHPYALIGRKTIKAALDEFQAICNEAGYPMHGELGKNFILPTAAGGLRQTGLIPDTMCAGDRARPGTLALANLCTDGALPRPLFRDFNASLAAANLKTQAINLPLPHPPIHRDLYATDLALLFDLAGYRDDIASTWKPILDALGDSKPKRLGLPAILGLDKSLEVKAHLETALGLELFEIPILPPSVPGMRLYNLLLNDFQMHGGRFIMGPVVRGKIENGTASIIADMNGRIHEYAATNIILATGGFLNGGLVADFDGLITEPVFNLPVEGSRTLNSLKGKDSPRAAWTSELFLGPHPFAKFGLRVNKNMQPLDASGKPAATNLRAIGAIIAGADRLAEGSREGIALSSAWRAIETVA
jgi:glycerol-3-phosphate dehydrogenase subunit B